MRLRCCRILHDGLISLFSYLRCSGTYPPRYPLHNTESKLAFPTCPKREKQHTSTPVISPRRLTQHLLRQLFEILQIDHPLQRRHLLPRVPHALLIVRQRPRGLAHHGRWVDRAELLVRPEVFFQCVGRMEGFEYLAFRSGLVGRLAKGGRAYVASSPACWRITPAPPGCRLRKSVTSYTYPCAMHQPGQSRRASKWNATYLNNDPAVVPRVMFLHFTHRDQLLPRWLGRSFFFRLRFRIE